MSMEFPVFDDLKREVFKTDMAKPPATILYVMHFTPWSGSSWVTELAHSTKRLSNPGELYNPNFLPRMAKAVNATSFEEYVAVLKRRRNTNGTYGFQITHHQLMKVFGSHQAFAREFPTSQWRNFWLIREDIVAQAVSLFKMVTTQLAHTNQTEIKKVIESDRTLDYDGDEIKRWVQHIRNAEIGTEAFFAENGITPFRLSYERNVFEGRERVVNLMAQHLELHKLPPPPENRHKKIATKLNEDFADRFRSDHARFVHDIEDDRATMLSLISDYTLAGEPPRFWTGDGWSETDQRVKASALSRFARKLGLKSKLGSTR